MGGLSLRFLVTVRVDLVGFGGDIGNRHEGVGPTAAREGQHGNTLRRRFVAGSARDERRGAIGREGDVGAVEGVPAHPIANTRLVKSLGGTTLRSKLSKVDAIAAETFSAALLQVSIAGSRTGTKRI